MLLIAAVVIGGGIALVVLLFGNRDTELVTKSLPLSSEMQYRIKDGTVSYIDNMTLNIYEADSESSRTVALNAAIDGYAVRDDVVVVFSGGTVHIEGCSEVVLTGTVRDVRMGEDYIAVLRTNVQGSDSIVIFDYNAQIAGEVLDFSDSKVTNFGFYTDNGRELLWIISVATEQSTPVTTVQMFDYGAGGTTSYLSPFYDQSVETLYFTDDSIFVVGTQDIVRYALTGGREKYRVGIYGYSVLDMAFSGGTATFLLAPKDEQASKQLRFLNLAEGDESLLSWRQFSFSEDILGAFLQQGMVHIVGTENVYSYSYTGRVSATLPLPEGVTAAYELDDTYFLLVTEGSMLRAELK